MPGVGLGVKMYNVGFYIDIYVFIFLDGHDLGTFYARKLKFGMLLTQT